MVKRSVSLIVKHSPKMKEKLIAIIISGADNEKADPAYKAAVFKKYIKRALPDVDVKNVKPIETAASLNSISAYVDITVQGSRYTPAFVKIHIESDTKSTSALGAQNEYSQANLLARHGWPMLMPLMSSSSREYPLLVYPRVEEKTLFDLVKNSYDKRENLITSGDLAILSRLNRQVGKAMVDSSKMADSEEAVNSPVQTLFFERFKEGGRIDEWYKPDTRFALTGMGKDMTWGELLETKWVINGNPYDITFSEIIENARRYLSFDGGDRTLVCVSHGDDHPGNIFMARKGGRAIIFDPAFAGWNPASLSNIKTFAHSCVLPMGGLYYDPKIGDISYSFDANKNVVNVYIPFENSVLYDFHEALAKQVVDLRIIPLIQKSKQTGVDLKSEYERIKYGLAGCALLTTNISRLLEQRDGRGKGLLPLTIMFAELKGLSMLDYLSGSLIQEL